MSKYLPEIKLKISHNELQVIEMLIKEVSDRDTYRLSKEEKLAVSIVREMNKTFKTSPYDLPKKAYSKKLKYHEAYSLAQMLSYKSSTTEDLYLMACCNILFYKIHKHL